MSVLRSDNSEKKKLVYQQGWISILVNGLLFLAKYWVGIITGSVALLRTVHRAPKPKWHISPCHPAPYPRHAARAPTLSSRDKCDNRTAYRRMRTCAGTRNDMYVETRTICHNCHAPASCQSRYFASVSGFNLIPAQYRPRLRLRSCRNPADSIRSLKLALVPTENSASFANIFQE